MCAFKCVYVCALTYVYVWMYVGERVGDCLLFYKLADSQPPAGLWVTHVG